MPDHRHPLWLLLAASLAALTVGVIYGIGPLAAAGAVGKSLTVLWWVAWTTKDDAR